MTKVEKIVTILTKLDDGEGYELAEFGRQLREANHNRGGSAHCLTCSVS